MGVASAAGSTAAAKVSPSRRGRGPGGRRRRPRRRARRAARRAGRSRSRCPSRARGRRARRSGRTSRRGPRRTARRRSGRARPGAHRRAEVAERRAEARRATSLHVGLGRRLAAVRGGEGRGAADHVLEHAAHGEVGARRRSVELVGRDAGDHAAEERAELVELVKRIHGSSVVCAAPRRAASLVAARPRSARSTSVVVVVAVTCVDHPASAPSSASVTRPISPQRLGRARDGANTPSAAITPAARLVQRGRCRLARPSATIVSRDRDRPGSARGGRHAR